MYTRLWTRWNWFLDWKYYSVPGYRGELPVGLPHICTRAATWRYWWWTRQTDCGECRSGCTSNSAWEWWMRRTRLQSHQRTDHTHTHTKRCTTTHTKKHQIIIRGTLIIHHSTFNLLSLILDLSWGDSLPTYRKATRMARDMTRAISETE